MKWSGSGEEIAQRKKGGKPADAGSQTREIPDWMALYARVRDLNAALLQLNPSADLSTNVHKALEWTEAALDEGADLVVLPEGYARVSPPVPDGPAPWALPPAQAKDSPAIAPFVSLSRGTEALVVLGGVSQRASAKKTYNSTVVLHRGAVVAQYHKVHRFDADLVTGSLRESGVVERGDRPVLLDWNGVRIGLSICYDLRFPELYRALASKGAHILLVPSAFTVPTGQAHWHTLLRARAIENQAFVLAPALVGVHRPGRESFGHTLAIDPWGEVLAEEPTKHGVVHARLDATRIARVRRTLPALEHRVVSCETSVEVTTLTSSDAPP